MEVGVLVYYLGNIINCYTRLFDIVTAGSFQYLDPDLPTINEMLNSEFTKRMEELNGMSTKERTEPFIPYPEVDLGLIWQTWYKRIRPELRKLEFKIKMAYVTIGESKLPTECTIFTHEMSNMIDRYELNKYKFESEQFRKYFEEQRRNESAGDALDKSFDIDFLQNREVKVVLKQYFEEFKWTFLSKSIRAPIILSGAIVEALLKEALLFDEGHAKEEYIRGKKEARDIEQWKFEELIDIAFKIGVMPKDLEKQTDVMRNFRNFVHLHRAVSSGIQLDNQYKELCKNALFIVVKEVGSWYQKKSSG